ncbi:MAG: TerC family protein [Deltaproteobacteria bacterium]|nr:TerC family protein [Deltaproteobacteria bacterium]
MSSQILLWVLFHVFIFSLLFLDLVVFHRKAHVIQVKEALLWSAFWISLALLFNVGIYFFKGPESALQFLTGYLLEESLSVDNLFVFIQLFLYFKIPALYQHKILFWGILGVVLMRATFILGGVALIQQFHWIMYVFGGFLVLTGLKMASGKEREIRPEKNPILRLFKHFIPVTTSYDGGSFFIKQHGKLFATPLFVTLLVVEMTDVVFAIDSIPAVLAISSDPFIVYSSNLMAVLGLRSLYFALAGMMTLFHYLKYGLSIILVFIGIKMLLSHVFHIPVLTSLVVLAVVLGGSILLSILRPPSLRSG